MKFISLVPARFGSKSIKNKNIIKLNNKPLINYTFEQIKKSKLKIRDCYIVSDDHRVKKYAKKFGANTDYIRPKYLSKDTTLFKENLFHFYDWTIKKKIFFDYVIILQPTSPLRKHYDINKSIALATKNKPKSLISLSESCEHPLESVYVKKNKINFFMNNKDIVRRQDFQNKSYFVNGAIFIISRKNLEKKLYINYKETDYFFMDKINSIDLNDTQDLEFLKKILV